MKSWIKGAAALALCGSAAMASAGNVDLGVSIEISQPGVFGRVDIGNRPPPQVIVSQPVIIAPPRAVVVRPEPVYLWVPPGHRREWRRYCGQYGACGVPVYFVRDAWYQENVYRGRGRFREDWRDDRRDERRVDWREERRDDRRGDRWDDDRRGGGRDDDRRGHGHGHGRGHD